MSPDASLDHIGTAENLDTVDIEREARLNSRPLGHANHVSLVHLLHDEGDKDDEKRTLHSGCTTASRCFR